MRSRCTRIIKIHKSVLTALLCKPYRPVQIISKESRAAGKYLYPIVQTLKHCCQSSEFFARGISHSVETMHTWTLILFTIVLNGPYLTS